MSRFQIILIVMILAITGMTVSAFRIDGIDLLTPFFAPVVAGTWQGQFNVDFGLYLILSGIWMAWRGGGTRSSIALGVLAPTLGMAFFAPYLLTLTHQTGGDMRKLLLGVHA